MKTTQQMNQELQSKFPFLEIISEYTGANNKVTIKCNDCGFTWDAIARSVLSSKHGCKNCKVTASKNQLARKHFLDKYDKSKYQLVEFKDSMNVTVKCNRCGYLRTTNANNIYRFGCPKCGQESTHNKQRLSQDEFISRATNIHGSEFDYSKVKYINYHTPVTIICPKHGEFYQSPLKHLSGHKCPKCRRSTGEERISKFLQGGNLRFIPQYRIEDTSFSQSHLKVDFFLPEHNTIIEFNGAQHYRSIEYFGGVEAFKKQLIRDDQLRNYCKNNEINLLEIPYDENNVEEVIQEFLSCRVIEQSIIL